MSKKKFLENSFKKKETWASATILLCKVEIDFEKKSFRRI